MEIYAGICLTIVAVVAVSTLWNIRHLASIFDRPPVIPEILPTLSLVVPARDEARNIESAVRRMLGSDYPNLEVVVVDDRSTDDTPSILARLGEEFDQLRAIRVDVLPEGWLGKVHALEQGRRAASGELILFIDGDVCLEPDTLKTAVARLVESALDHVAMVPVVHSASKLCQPFLNTMLHALVSAIPAREVSDPASPVGIGSGCFNLVRSDVLESLGGLEPLRLDLIDDASLGYRIASRGFRSVGYSGRDALRVEWYSGLGDMLRGFEKNAFAGVRFRLSEALLVSATTVAIWGGVFIAPWGGRPELAWFAAFVIAFNTVATIVVSRRLGLEWWPDLFHPIGLLGLPVILLRSAFRAVGTGEIRWRDTSYPLATLREAQSCDLSVLRRIRMGLVKPKVIVDDPSGGIERSAR